MPDEVKVNDATISDPISIANELNSHFVTKGPKLASRLPKSRRNILQSMGPRNSHTMSFTPISVNEILNTVNEFVDKKSTGSDDIPSILFKWAINIIAPKLAFIFNQLVDHGLYPEDLKIAKVTPLHKKGDKSDLDNFRPISVLTQFNKLFEKLIHVRLMTFIDKHKILKDYQFGFRKKHNTSHGISYLNEQLIKNLEKRKSVLSCLLI